jgi:hypothetical protein
VLVKLGVERDKLQMHLRAAPGVLRYAAYIDEHERTLGVDGIESPIDVSVHEAADALGRRPPTVVHWLNVGAHDLSALSANLGEHPPQLVSV